MRIRKILLIYFCLVGLGFGIPTFFYYKSFHFSISVAPLFNANRNISKIINSFSQPKEVIKKSNILVQHNNKISDIQSKIFKSVLQVTDQVKYANKRPINTIKKNKVVQFESLKNAINNRELVKLTGFKVAPLHVASWTALLDKKRIFDSNIDKVIKVAETSKKKAKKGDNKNLKHKIESQNKIDRPYVKDQIKLSYSSLKKKNAKKSLKIIDKDSKTSAIPIVTVANSNQSSNLKDLKKKRAIATISTTSTAVKPVISRKTIEADRVQNYIISRDDKDFSMPKELSIQRKTSRPPILDYSKNEYSRSFEVKERKDKLASMNSHGPAMAVSVSTQKNHLTTFLAAPSSLEKKNKNKKRSSVTKKSPKKTKDIINVAKNDSSNNQTTKVVKLDNNTSGQFNTGEVLFKNPKPKKINKKPIKRKIFKRRTKAKYSKTDITLSVIKINQGIVEKVRGFQFVPAYDPNKYLYDDVSTGILVLEENLNGEMSVLRGAFSHKDIITTNVDIVLEEDVLELNILTLEPRELEIFLKEKQLNWSGGFLFIDLDEEVDEVIIDKGYDAKYFFDANFKLVDNTTQEYRYLLLAGVEPGNTLITYTTLDGGVAERILHVKENELLFDINFLVDKSIERVQLFEKLNFSEISTELKLDEDYINYFHSTIVPKNIGGNLYEYVKPVIPLGMRQYLEFKHLDDSIFVGHWNKKEIELPGEDFISSTLSKLDIDVLENQCLVQINLDKPIKDFYVAGETAQGPMFIKKTVFDKDGIIDIEENGVVEVTELTDKIFLEGDLQGMMSLKLEYLDGSVDYLTTYCSDSTYLIEQL